MASGQITMRRVGGWQTLDQAPVKQPIDLDQAPVKQPIDLAA